MVLFFKCDPDHTFSRYAKIKTIFALAQNLLTFSRRQARGANTFPDVVGMLACCHLRSSQIESIASHLKLDHHAFEFQSSGILKICLTAPHAGRKSGANLCFLIPQIVFGLTIFLAVATSLHTSPCNEFGVNTNCQEAKGITTSASDNKKKKPCQIVEHPGNLKILGKSQQGKTST